MASTLPEWAPRTGLVAAGAVAALGVAAVLMRRYAAGGINPHHPSMTGKVVLITGANTGIGLEAARELASLGAHVILAGRNAARVKAACEAVQRTASAGGQVESLIVDLSDRASVEAASKVVRSKHSKLDILVNNAGIMFTVGRERSEGAGGFEEQFQTNVIGHVLLTNELLPLLEAAEGSPRIINVASSAHRLAPATMYEDLQSKKWAVGMAAYGITKLGNMLHARGLNARLEEGGSRVRAYSLHPGVVDTELLRNSPWWVRTVAQPFQSFVTKTPVEGAQTTLYLCLAPDEELKPGSFYADCAESPVSAAPGLWSLENARAFTAAVDEMARTGKPMDAVPGARV